MSEPERKAYRIPQFCQAFGIGRSTVYEEIAKGRLRTFKLGRKITLISKEAADEWLTLCQSDSAKASSER